jgi:hypothetical protein
VGLYVKVQDLLECNLHGGEVMTGLGSEDFPLELDCGGGIEGIR